LGVFMKKEILVGLLILVIGIIVCFIYSTKIQEEILPNKFEEKQKEVKIA
jgi:hypothetical protein